MEFQIRDAHSVLVIVVGTEYAKELMYDAMLYYIQKRNLLQKIFVDEAHELLIADIYTVGNI